MTLSIMDCWTCGKRLPENCPEETFFWCNKECYDKDDLYHGRRALAQQKKWEEAERKQEKAELKAANKEKAVDQDKEERKRKIREALGKKEKPVCPDCKGTGWVDSDDHMRNKRCKPECEVRTPFKKKKVVKTKKTNKQKKPRLTTKKTRGKVKT